MGLSLEGQPGRETRTRTGTGTGTGIGIGIKKEVSISAATAPEEPQKLSEGYTAEFEAWWAAYPRKEGKGAAYKAYRLAKKRAPVERLLAAATRYATARRGQDQQYTKQAATWLNGDCWHDEPPVTAASRIKFPGYVPMASNGG